MATKGKMKRYDDGGNVNSSVTQDDLDAANASDDAIQTLNKRKGWTDTGDDSPAVAPKFTPKGRKDIVTKEELDKSGLSLRDYMNQQRGLTRKGSSAGAGRGVRGGPTADEQMTPMERLDRQTGVRSGRTNEIASDNSAPSSAWVDTQNTLNALGGLGNTLRVGLGAARAAKAATSGSRAVAPAFDEVTFLGRSGGQRIAPEAERLADSASKAQRLTSSADKARIGTNPPSPRIPGGRPPKSLEWQTPEMGRESATNPLSWMAGPKGASNFKKGGAVKAFAKGGAVKSGAKAGSSRSTGYRGYGIAKKV